MITDNYDEIRGDYIQPTGAAKGCISRVVTNTTDPVTISLGSAKVYGVLIVQGALSAKVQVHDAGIGETLTDSNRRLIASVAGLPGYMDGFILPFPVAMQAGLTVEADQADCIVTILYLP